jgi:hypothetical protein
MEQLGQRDHSSLPPARLDPTSRASLQGFAVQLAILTAVSLGLGGRAPLATFILLSTLAGQFNSVSALLSGHRWGRGPLNRWDVGMMHFAVSLAARFVHVL